jgi:hypothetical protein
MRAESYPPRRADGVNGERRQERRETACGYVSRGVVAGGVVLLLLVWCVVLLLVMRFVVVYCYY